MDEPLSSEIDRLQDTQVLHRLLVYETACALAESASLADAAPRMLRAVCVSLNCEYGAFWEVDRARTSLRWVSSWQQRSADFEAFADVSRQMVVRRGTGLPGRVWAAGQPAWIPDIQQDDNFPRRAMAARVGLQSAFAMPMLRDGDVLGVMEFFSRDTRPPDEDLVLTLGTIGAQIGVYVDRKRSTEELDRFFTVSLDLLGIANFDGYFLRVNPAFARVLGFSEAELLAAPFIDFVHPDDRAATLGAMASLSQGVHVINFENRYRTGDGSYKWLEWAAAPVPEQGIVYAAARDVTDRTLAEQALKDYAAQLERARLEQEQNAERLAQLVRARHRPPPSGRGDARERRVSRQHEPRDPHADERHHRHDRPGAAHAADAAAARLHPHGQRLGGGAARDHQRHPRRLEDRGARPRARPRAVQPARYGRRRGEAAGAARAREGPGARVPHRCPKCPMRSSAIQGGCGRSWSTSWGTPSSSPNAAR